MPIGAGNLYRADTLYTNVFQRIIEIDYGETEVEPETTTATLTVHKHPGVKQYKVTVFEQGKELTSFLYTEGTTADTTTINTRSNIVRRRLPKDQTTEVFVIELEGLTAGTNYSYSVDGYTLTTEGGETKQEVVYKADGAFTTKPENTISSGIHTPAVDMPDGIRQLPDGLLISRPGITIYDIGGHIISSNRTGYIPLEKGLYIISSNTQSGKVIIR